MYMCMYWIEPSQTEGEWLCSASLAHLQAPPQFLLHTVNNRKWGRNQGTTLPVLLVKSTTTIWWFCQGVNLRVSDLGAPWHCVCTLQAAVGAYYDFYYGTQAPEMVLVQDITVGNGESVTPHTQFSKCWRVKNSGMFITHLHMIVWFMIILPHIPLTSAPSFYLIYMYNTSIIEAYCYGGWFLSFFSLT